MHFRWLGALLVAGLAASASAAEWRHVTTNPVAAPWSTQASFALRTPAAQLGGDSRVLVTSTSDAAPFVSVSSVDPTDGETRWAWHTGYSLPTYVEYVVPCGGGGFVIAGQRRTAEPLIEGQREIAAWIARVDSAGTTVWQLDVAATRSDSNSFGFGMLAASSDCAVLARPTLGVAPSNGQSVALTADEGRVAWTIGDDALNGFPVAVAHAGAAGIAVVAEGPARELRVAMLDPQSGTRRWSRLLADLSPESPQYYPQLHFAGGPSVGVVVQNASASFTGIELHVLDALDGSPIGAGGAATATRPRQLVDLGPAGFGVATERDILRFSAQGAPVGARNYADARAVAIAPDGAVLVSADGGGGHVRLHEAADDSVRWTSAWPWGSPPYNFGVAAGGPLAVGFGGGVPPWLNSIRLADGALGPLVSAKAERGGSTAAATVAGDAVIESLATLDTDTTTYEVSRIERFTGAVIWTTRFPESTTARHDSAWVSRPIVGADGNLTLAGSSCGYGAPPNYVYECTSVLARLRASDGVVLGRETNAEGWLVRDIEVAGGDLYAARFQFQGGPNASAIDRLDGINRVWRHILVDDGEWPVGIPTMLATPDGIIVQGATPNRQLLRRSNGAVGWAVSTTYSSPTRMFAHASGDAFVVTRRDGPGAFADIGVERVDRATGATLWTTFLEGTPGAWDSHAFYSTALDDGLLLTWKTAPNPNVSAYQMAIARIRDDGVLLWQRLQDAGPAVWSTHETTPVLRPGGTVLLPLMAAPRALLGTTPAIGLQSLLELSIADGTSLRYRPMATVFERGAASGDRLASLIDADSANAIALLSMLQAALPLAPGSASVRLDGVAANGIVFAAQAQQVPGERRRLRVQITAGAQSLAPDTSVTISIVLPYGLIADSTTCGGTNVQCSGSGHMGVVRQPMTWSGDASASIVLEAEAIDFAEVQGDLRVVLDIDAPIAGGDLAARVITVPWALQQQNASVFANGFEP